MLRRNGIAAGVFAGLFAFTMSANAQEQKSTPPETVKTLEAQLAKLRMAEAELQAKLKQLTMEAEGKRVREARGEQDKALQLRLQRENAERRQDDQGRRAQVEIEKGVQLRLQGSDRGQLVLVAPGAKGPGYDQMTPAQLKELIGKLQKILDEKTRSPDKAKRGEPEKDKRGNFEDKKRGDNDKEKRGNFENEKRGESEKRGEDKKPGASQADILKRLDQLSREIEEMRRAIKK